jgi:oligogalacturonide lyase
MLRLLTCLILLSLVVRAAEPPTDWIDATTGHRIMRLSREPDTASLYFHQDAFTKDGTRVIVVNQQGIATIDLLTRETRVIVPDVGYRPGSSAGIEVGAVSGDVYYFKDRTLYAVNPDTLVQRTIVSLNEGDNMSDINADESLLVGTYIKPDPNRPSVNTWPPPGTVMHASDGRVFTFAEMREVLINQRLEQRVPTELFTVDLKTGARTVIHATTDWLGHVQFSPTDRTLIMFCHEGNWHKVDRIWTIRTDGYALSKIHTRTMNMEIAGHEFMSPDGATIWYDLQTPRGEDFWLAGYDFADGKRRWYHLERNEWSVHFNVSPDGTLFAGDGGDPEMVAHAPDGKYLYLYRPRGIPDVAEISAPGAENLISPGVLEAEKLVDLRNHDYRLEPNVHFTPDQKWIVFRSNLHGPIHTYAVEIAKP